MKTLKFLWLLFWDMLFFPIFGIINLDYAINHPHGYQHWLACFIVWVSAALYTDIVNDKIEAKKNRSKSTN